MVLMMGDSLVKLPFIKLSNFEKQPRTSFWLITGGQDKIFACSQL
jgi:hypothetical protein